MLKFCFENENLDELKLRKFVNVCMMSQSSLCCCVLLGWFCYLMRKGMSLFLGWEPAMAELVVLLQFGWILVVVAVSYVECTVKAQVFGAVRLDSEGHGQSYVDGDVAAQFFVLVRCLSG